MVVETRLYDILSVAPEASIEEISKAYKKVALKCHPDKTNHDPQLTEKFKEITRAYEILKDKQTRSVYDHYGESSLGGSYSASYTSKEPAKPRKYGGAYNVRTATNIFSQVFNDINSMFGHESYMDGFDTLHLFLMNMGAEFAMSGGGAATSNMKRHVQPAPGDETIKLVRGEDIHHTCKVTLGELSTGKVVRFQLPKRSKCPQCIGLGGSNPKLCKICQGNGRVIVTTYNSFTKMQEIASCASCHGTGIYISPNQVCLHCDRGYIKEKKIIKINILPGFKSGDRVILQGEADEGRNIIPGDVVIHLQQVPHPYLIRKSHDLFMEYEIDLKQALFGGAITIKDFLKKDQDLKVYINAAGDYGIKSDNDDKVLTGEVIGTINPGTPKIVKGFGMPINKFVIDDEFFQNSEDTQEILDTAFDLHRYIRGDLFIKFNVRLPTLDEFSSIEDMKLLKQLLPGDDGLAHEFDGERTTLEANLSNIPNYENNKKQAKRVQFNTSYNDKASYNDNKLNTTWKNRPGGHEYKKRACNHYPSDTTAEDVYTESSEDSDFNSHHHQNHHQNHHHTTNNYHTSWNNETQGEKRRRRDGICLDSSTNNRENFAGQA